MASEDPRDRDLEMELLELELRAAMTEKSFSDLSRKVSEALRNDDRKGEQDMIATAGIMEPRPLRWPAAISWNALVNAACVLALTVVVVSVWSRGLSSKGPSEPGSPDGAPAMMSADSDAAGNTPRVTSLADVKSLPPGLSALICEGPGFGDEALQLLCRTQRNLESLEIRATWVTEKSVVQLGTLPKLRDLALPSNDFIGRRGWDAVASLRNLRSLNLNIYLGQTAVIDGEEPDPGMPPRGIPPGPFMIPGINAMPQLVKLQLQGHRLSEEDIKTLTAGRGPSLEYIDVTGTGLSAPAMRLFSRWTKLDTLRAVDVCRGTDGVSSLPLEALGHVKSLVIGANGMSWTSFPDTLIDGIASLTRLEHVEFQSTTFTEEQLFSLSSHETLKRLSLMRCKGLNDRILMSLGAMPELSDLRLLYCTGVTSRGLKAFAGKGSLALLDLRGSTDDVLPDAIKTVLDNNRTLAIICSGPNVRTVFARYIYRAPSDSEVILKYPRQR